MAPTARAVRAVRVGSRGGQPMRPLGVIASAVVIFGLSASSASAVPRWIGREFDASDVLNPPNCGGSFGPCLGWDIGTVTFKIRDADNGRAYLTITLRSFNPEGGFASDIALDTRGDRRADYRLPRSGSAR